MRTRDKLTKVSVPEGQSGQWRVESFTVSEADAKFENLRAAIGASARPIEPGTYTRLMRAGSMVMSDTPMEMRDHEHFVASARGNVLIGGLGLGMVLQAVLRKKDVAHVTVIERSADVLKLVGRHYRDVRRLSMVYADLMTWHPPKRSEWDVGWFDIWDGICADNLADMRTLKRRFTPFVSDLGFWCYVEHLRSARRFA